MKKKYLWLLAVPVVWLLLSEALWRLEVRSDSASITNLGQALWFSLVTLTTVGYGDMYPVTLAGKLVGVIFILLSTGFVAFLVCMVISAVTGRLYPALRLLVRKKDHWYIFTDSAPASVALMEELAGQKGCCLIFSGEKPEAELPRQVICTEDTPRQLVAARGGKESCSVFFLTPDRQENYRRARETEALAAAVYCHSSYTPDALRPDLRLYDSDDGCARLYWHRHPLLFREAQVVLIGMGNAGRRLLERGLLCNLRQMPVTYHVFGDSDDFRNDHPALDQTVSLSPEGEGDRVLFHREAFNAMPEILENADRILICPDTDREAMEILGKLRRYFPVRGKIHLRLSYPLEGETTFGTTRELFSADLVIGRRLEQTARALHGIYCRGVADAPAWEALTEFKRQSNVAAADHILTKVRLLLQDDTLTRVTVQAAEKACAVFEAAADKTPYRYLEHDRWMRFHYLYNWRCAPQRQDALRQHHLLVPFESLSPEEQAKDDYPWQLLGALSRVLAENEEEIS